MKRQLTFVWLALALPLIPFLLVLKSGVSASDLKNYAPAVRAKLSDSATMQDRSQSDVKPTTKPGSQGSPNVGITAPTNDNCASAVAVTTLPFTDTKSNVGATTEAGEPAPCGSIDATMWYSYTNTKPNPVSVTASTCTSGPTDTVMAAYKVSGAACAFAGFVNVACNDDFCGDGFQSTIAFDAAPGATYKIQVGSFSGSTGSITTNISGVEQMCPPVIINGTLGSGAPGFAGVQFSGDQTGRLNRNGIASTCAAPKTCQIFDPAGLRKFDAYRIPNQSGQDACVSITLNEDAAATCNIQSNAYLDTYVPSTICTGYLGDPGLSSGVPPIPTNFSVIVPAGHTLIVVVHTVTPGESGCAYTLTVTGNLCVQFDYCVQDDNNPRRFIQINSTTGAYTFTDCGKDLTLSGQGSVASSPCKIELFDQGPIPKHPDRLVDVQVNPCKLTGDAIIQFGSNSITLHDSNLSNNTCDCTVQVVPCTITCPDDVTTDNGPNATQCGSKVSYPAPDVGGGCGPAACAPASGSFFSVGSTIVRCTIPEGPNCSFTITVVDNASPRITCPDSIVTGPAQGQSSAVVNYPAATVTANCPGATAQCSPPAGSRFPLGTTFVTCTAVYPSSNSATCVFSVTVRDSEPPTIRCPANLTVGTQAGQTSAVVNYPPPSVTDNVPGATVLCSPASGSSFPLGVTTITCTATDAGGNKSVCSFTAGVGGPQAKVTVPGGKAAVEFGNPISVAPVRKPPKARNNPCGVFTVQNIGFASLVLTLDAIARTGNDVDSRRIADANDTRYFDLSLLASDGSSIPIDFGGVVTIQPGGAQSFCLRFKALIPALAGKATGVAAANALPDTVTSTVTFRQNAGSPVSVSVLSHLATAVIFMNPTNPRQAPSILFTRSGNDLTVSYGLYDPNLDVSRAKYEFLAGSGQVVGSAFEIDLTEQLRALGLVRGQSFAVEQRFTGANDHPEIVGVRVTVFDGETSVTDSATAAASVSTASIRLFNRTGDLSSICRC